MTDDADHPTAAEDAGELTLAVLRAKSGFRRDVAELVRALDDAELFVPLASAIDGVPHGERVELEDELRLVPHLLVTEEGKLFCALFTEPELMEPIADELEWTTDGQELEYCSVPARLALDMALDVIDERAVLGLVINPLHESELVLRREELGSIAQGKPVPLPGYVEGLPGQDSERTLVAEAGDPPPQALVEALERALAEEPEVADYRLERTFNPDRDLEPHLTLTLRTRRAELDHQTISSRIVTAIEAELPPPGYIDVVFEPLS
jgi:hypothetical protein